jgi:hypothetical protein
MNLIYSLSLSFVVIATLSCSSVVKKNKGDFGIFPVEKKLDETQYLKINEISPDGLLLHADSLLFIRNTANTAKHHFSLFNLNKKSFQHYCLPAGRKPGHSLSFMSYGISYGYLWVHDKMKEKVILADLDSIISGGQLGTKEIPITTYYYALQLLNDSNVIASGNYDAPYKIYHVNLATSKIEKQAVPYSQDSAEYPRTKKMAYESFLFLKPTGDKCALACRYADQVEIVDLTTLQSKVIKGPEGYDPAVIVMKGNDGRDLSTRGPDTRYAFVKGKVTNKYIYLLYSGNNHESDHLWYGKYIYVYDWNGNPVKRLELKNYVLDFVVTQDDSRIYTYDPAAKYIMTANLD